MHAAHIIGLLLLLQAAGCSVTPPSPADDKAVIASPAPVPPLAEVPAPATAVAETSPAPPPTPPALVTPQPLVIPPAPVAAPALPPQVVTVAPKDVPRTDKPAAKAPARPAAAPVAKPAAPAPAPLALTTLEQRLKDTPAIGVFTKITLKNQVDELLDRFRAHYEGRGGATLAQLRQSYDQLLAKVHELLKDGDPALATAIANSREAIWNVLTDPVKFAKL